jgi:heme/copper-type cytochrome/quinol oxidase subunit 4
MTKTQTGWGAKNRAKAELSAPSRLMVTFVVVVVAAILVFIFVISVEKREPATFVFIFVISVIDRLGLRTCEESAIGIRA